jgi:hypothetical protein
MSEKQFNHIDNRIREAAENSEPAFDEYAWTLMEARLDKEDAKKRRYFFWWLAVPMLFITVGGIYIFSDQKGTEKLPADQKIQEMVENKIVPQKNAPAVTHNIDDVNNNVNKINEQNTTGNYPPNSKILRGNDVVTNNKPNNSSGKTKAIKGGKLSSNTTPVTAVENDEIGDMQEPVILMVDEKPVTSKSSDDAPVNINDHLSKIDSSKISHAKILRMPKHRLNRKIRSHPGFIFLQHWVSMLGALNYFRLAIVRLRQNTG